MQEKDLEKMQRALSKGELFDDSLAPFAVEDGIHPAALVWAIVLAFGFWFLFVYFVEMAHAHPADDLCRPDQVGEDGCQVPRAELGLNIPEFYVAHRRYWHSRRSLAVEIVELGECTGARAELQALLGEPVNEGEQALLKYWNVIPAHPEYDRGFDPSRADEQTLASEATRAITQVLTWLCQYERGLLSARVSARLNAPPPVCPICKKRR